MKTIAQKLADLRFKRPFDDNTTHAVLDELAAAREEIAKLRSDIVDLETALRYEEENRRYGT